MHVYITGSFALQCVRGAITMYDKDSDIDLNSSTANEPMLALFLTDNGYGLKTPGT